MAEQAPLSSRVKQIIEVDGLRFRDLDGDGELTPFEDWRLSPPSARRIWCAACPRTRRSA